MPRKRFLWKVRGREILLGDHTLLVASVELKCADGRRMEPDRAFALASKLEEAGAGVIDLDADPALGGSDEEELRCLVPVLRRLRGKLAVPVCVTTSRAAVAERAIELGAEIIRDPTGLTFEPALVKAVVDADAGLVLGHIRGKPDAWARQAPLPDPVTTVFRDLEAALHRAHRAGLGAETLAVDPGLGFGKRKEENTRILGGLSRLAALAHPVAVAIPAGMFASAVGPAVTAAVLGGAHIVRVADLAAALPAAQLADAILAAG